MYCWDKVWPSVQFQDCIHSFVISWPCYLTVLLSLSLLHRMAHSTSLKIVWLPFRYIVMHLHDMQFVALWPFDSVSSMLPHGCNITTKCEDSVTIRSLLMVHFAPVWGRGTPLFHLALFTFLFLSLALLIFFFCPSLPFLPEWSHYVSRPEVVGNY